MKVSPKTKQAFVEIRGEAAAAHSEEITRELVESQPCLRRFQAKPTKPSGYCPYFFATEKEINNNVLHRNPVPECDFHPSGMVLLRIYDVYAVNERGRVVSRMSPNKRSRRRIVDWLDSMPELETVHALILRQICYAVPASMVDEPRSRRELYWLGSVATVYASPPQWLRHLVNRVITDTYGEKTHILTMQELKRGVEREDERFLQAQDSLRGYANAFLDGVWPRLKVHTRGKRVWCGIISGEEKFCLRVERPRCQRNSSQRHHTIVTLRARGQHVSFDLCCTGGNDRYVEIALDDISMSLDFVDFLVSFFAHEFMDLEEVRAQA